MSVLAAQLASSKLLHHTHAAPARPAEVGAAAAALLSPAAQAAPAAAAPARLPLAFLASKAVTGHAEPAAGSVALAHATAACLGSACLPIPHLTTLNAHVAPALTSSVEPGSRGWVLPRQLQPSGRPMAAATGGAGAAGGTAGGLGGAGGEEQPGGRAGGPSAIGASAFAYQVSAWVGG